MTEPRPRVVLESASGSHAERLFPKLTAAQIARIAAHGRRRAISRGETLVEIGDRRIPFFLVLSGAIEVSRPSGDTDTVIVTHHAGQFSGEATMLTGRRAFSRDTPAETMTAILREDVPDLSSSGRQIPPPLDRIVRRCID